MYPFLARHHPVLVDGRHHGGDGLLPVRVVALEGFPEVVEDLRVQEWEIAELVGK